MPDPSHGMRTVTCEDARGFTVPGFRGRQKFGRSSESSHAAGHGTHSEDVCVTPAAERPLKVPVGREVLRRARNTLWSSVERGLR